MAKSKDTQAQPEVGNSLQQTPEGSVELLRNAVESIDGYSQEAFGQIVAIARLALSHLESPRGCQDTEVVAVALEAIQAKAEMAQPLIAAEAEEVGCSCTGGSFVRRYAARLKGGAV